MLWSCRKSICGAGIGDFGHEFERLVVALLSLDRQAAVGGIENVIHIATQGNAMLTSCHLFCPFGDSEG